MCIVKWFASQRKPVQQLVSAGYKDENGIYRLLIYQITIPMALSVRQQIGSNMTSCLILYPGRAAIENAPVPWQVKGGLIFVPLAVVPVQTVASVANGSRSWWQYFKFINIGL